MTLGGDAVIGALSKMLAVGLTAGAGSAWAGMVDVPVEVGVGPAFSTFTGPLADEQPFHTGLSISAAAVLDQEFLRANRRRVPRQYRAAVTSMGEARVGVIFIPDTIFISPGRGGTSIYGASWSPLSIGLPLIGGPSAGVSAKADAVLSAAWIHSPDEAIGTTWFLRPGLGIGVEAVAPLFGGLSIAAGWSSRFYPPQEIGGSPEEIVGLENSIWHEGQGALRLCYRFSYPMNL